MTPTEQPSLGSVCIHTHPAGRARSREPISLEPNFSCLASLVSLYQVLLCTQDMSRVHTCLPCRAVQCLGLIHCSNDRSSPEKWHTVLKTVPAGVMQGVLPLHPAGGGVVLFWGHSCPPNCLPSTEMQEMQSAVFTVSSARSSLLPASRPCERPSLKQSISAGLFMGSHR